jgi:formamidopyrimidine-DNA glycosylase
MLRDLLLDQNLFAGSGNIIKNEVLFDLGLPRGDTGGLQVDDATQADSRDACLCAAFLRMEKGVRSQKKLADLPKTDVSGL